MTHTSLTTVLASARQRLPANIRDFDSVLDLLVASKEDIRSGMLLLDVLDSVSVVATLMTEHNGSLVIDSSVQNPDWLCIELLKVATKPQWLIDLSPYLKPMVFQYLADVDPSSADIDLFSLFVPDGVILGSDNGTFKMGSTDESAPQIAKPVHSVTLSNFWLSKSEVSQALYWSVMGNNPSQSVGMSRPVENISWFDAVEFCNKLSEHLGLSPAYEIIGEDVQWNQDSNGFRLPTEAEWEFAAAEGNDDHINLKDKAWWSDDWDGSTKAIMQLEPNSFGLYDIQGNVSEWCWDWFGRYSAQAQTDPTGSNSGRTKVHRGGSWNSPESGLDVHARANISPIITIGSIGLRLCKSIQS